MTRPLLIGVSLTFAACTPEDVVAKVGSRELHRADVAVTVAGRSKAAPLTPSEALDALVDRELLAEGARRAGLANDDVLKTRLATYERELLAQALLDKEAKGLDDVTLKQRYHESEKQLRTRQVHVAQIFVSAQSPDPDGRVHALYARVSGGEDFAAVAKEASDDRPSAERGGDVGVVREGQVDATFFAAAVELKAGALSKPLHTEHGYHLLKALEEPGEVMPSFEEVRGRLLADARRDLETALRARLAKEITVKRYPDHLTGAPSK